MIKRTFLDKTNTIKRGSNENYGLHPICMLNYGHENTRVLIHFPIEDIRGFLTDKEHASGCTHTLKMTNCGSIDIKKYGLTVPSNDINGEKKRATSFTIYAFPIEEEWDEGVGFDSTQDFWLSGEKIVSSEGSNWFNRESGYKWLKTGCIGLDVDVDSAIAMQHFDHGNENLELDITEYVNKVLSGELENNGLCLIFDPELEESDLSKLTQYVGFFGNKTNTFYEPVVESRIDDYVKDDRYDFILGKDNRLYLYCSFECGEDNQFMDLTELPVCTIDGVEYPVTHQDRGIYYATVNITGEPDEIHYDVWSNLVIGGSGVEDMEFEFVTHPARIRFNLGPEITQDIIYEPALSGLNDDETLNEGDERKVNVRFRVPYSTKYFTINNAQYRIYSKDNNREVTVIDWEWINNAGRENYFIVKADELVPGDYYVDIRVRTKSQVKTFKDKLRFKKNNDITRVTR